MSTITILGTLLLVSLTPGDDDRDTVARRLRENRERLIERLEEYRALAEFPTPDAEAMAIGSEDPHFDAERGRVHSFRGSNGALCALAHLIAGTNGELVERIVADDNHLCVGTTENTEILDWVLESGLTREECILIQEPGFEFDDGSIAATGIDAHLERVLATLREQTEESLRIAIERRMAG